MIAWSLALAAPFLLAASLLPGWLFVVVLAMAGFFPHSTLPVNVIFGQPLAPVSAAIVSSLMMGFAWAMGGFSVPIVGAFADRYGIERTLLGLAIVPTACGGRLDAAAEAGTGLIFAWYDTDWTIRQTMPRSPRLSTIPYSFGPGPMTPAVRALLFANGAVYLVSLFYTKLIDWFGLVPENVVHEYRVWQLASYMFLHARTPTHILFNMLILWMFGVELERMWRTPFFVKFYFVTGIGAGIISVIVSLLPFNATSATYDSVIIGASGALYGLLLAYAYYFPERPILMFLLFPVPAKIFVAILGAIAFVQAVEVNGGVAATTHLGGMLVGYIYLQGGRGGWTAEIKYRYLKWKMNRMRRKFDVYSGGRSEKNRWDRHVH